MISTSVHGKLINFYPANLGRILSVPTGGWGHYMKESWPPLDNLPSTLDICRKFSGNPLFPSHHRVMKNKMSSLYQLYFDVIHKMILPRQERHTFESFIDLTLIELLDSEIPIDLPQLIITHMQRVLVKNKNGHVFPYQLWLAPVFDDFSADLLTATIGDCGYPTVCGNYSVCGNGKCSCPQIAVGPSNFLHQINYRQKNQGCLLVTPISCEHSQYHVLMEHNETGYIPRYLQYGTHKTELENCRRSCLSNCSCKAAQFRLPGPDNMMGHCALLNEGFSLTNSDGTVLNKTTFFLIKVQNASKTKPKHVEPIIGSTIGASLGLLFMVFTCFVFLFRRRKQLEEAGEEFLDQVPGMPSRFSDEELTLMTEYFS
ncbi:hypothetical protein T459_20356 [Capsicum annuum]|uniref:Apple domain-containing protein n=1 Tax=Capsicum annuum TaxID=4072 RepID=A0A2G2Z4F9_CAPAN|nr:putative G-type lectin S-receptor-like serine/threonine-protein kinase SD2-5-like [Capsicum annuum]PHT76834.1 hypothetical protein T459_20356 [Capsicum annuum]